MSGWLFLAASLVGAGFTASALLRARRLWFFTPVYFMAAWLTGELALHHVVWQAAATLVFAAFGALETWPGLAGLALSFASWAGLITLHLRAQAAAPGVQRQIAGDEAHRDVETHRLLNPFRMRTLGVKRVRNVPYGEPLEGDKGRRNLLDVVHPTAAGKRAPVLVQIHGGGWCIGEKEQQAQPLMHHLASQGWVCFAPNYRLSPQATFPDHIVDVKRALAWVRENAASYGGDPDFICITGGSAGGHLAALAALSANDPAYQPGFEDSDTRVAACVPFYGVYDLLDRQGIRGSMSMAPFLEKRVFKTSPDQSRELWEQASPLTRVSEEAPPFLVVHGSHDSLVFVEEAHAFVEALREKSRQPVHYAEFRGAQHAFDSVHSLNSAHAVRAVSAFLERIHAGHKEARNG